VLARNLVKQPFQYFDHNGVPVIDLATMHRIQRWYVRHLSFNLLLPTYCEFCALPVTGTVPQADIHRGQHV
jgi:hypothetical protein